MQGHLFDERFVEAVIGLGVADDHAEQVIDIAGHAVDLDHFGHVGDGVRKFGQPDFVVLVGFELHKHREAQVQLLAVEQCHPAFDDAAAASSFWMRFQQGV